MKQKIQQKGKLEVRKNIAQRLKALREKAGFSTPDEFCKKYNFDFFTYERGFVA